MRETAAPLGVRGARPLTDMAPDAGAAPFFVAKPALSFVGSALWLDCDRPAA
jgi:hypothetical protein